MFRLVELLLILRDFIGAMKKLRDEKKKKKDIADEILQPNSENFSSLITWNMLIIWYGAV